MIAKINLTEKVQINELIQPDSYHFDLNGDLIIADPQFVISRKKNGETLSKYKDQIWDFTPYSNRTIRLYFKNIKNVFLREEVKRLLFILVTLSEGRRGAIKSPNTIYMYYQTLFVHLTKFASIRNITIKELFEKDEYLEQSFIYLYENSTGALIFMMSFMQFLNVMRNKHSGIEYVHNNELYKKLSTLHNKFKNKNKQTAPIPVEIYLEASKQRWEHIERLEKNIHKICTFLHNFMSSKYFAMQVDNSYPTKGEKYIEFVSWKDAVSKHKLECLFSLYGVHNRKSFSYFITQLQGTCRHLIYSYTGMRHDEGKMLKADCYIKKSKEHPPIILGITKKLHGAPVPLKWVTVPEVGRIINLLHKINRIVIKNRFPNLKEEPLFISTHYVTYNFDKNLESYALVHAIGKDPTVELPLNKELLKISKKHIDEELSAIEPEREWKKEDKFQVGKTWHFTYHQYRRSLAVYSLGSGLVSIKSMQRQFGHLFQAMTSYYGNGSFAAKSLIGIDNKAHINSYMKTIKGEIDFLSYFKNVLFNVNKLYGAHGQFVEKNSLEIKNHILADKKKTIKQFNNGLLYYKETAIGGCTSVEPCDGHMFRLFNSCFGCEHGYQEELKILNTIEEQEEFVSILEEGTVEHRTELAELEELKKNYEIIRRKTNE